MASGADDNMPDNAHGTVTGASVGGWGTIAATCRVLGAVGLAVLIFAIAASLWISHEANNNGGCGSKPLKNVDVSLAATGVRITGLQPAALELNHALCVQVDNVVAPTKEAELLANLRLSAEKVALADVAAKSTTATTPAKPADTSSAATLADATQIAAKANLASAKNAFDEGQKGRTIVLYLNGKASPLKAVAQPIPGPQTLVFDIAAPDDASSADAAYWRSLLSEPAKDGRIPLRVGVAEEGAPAPPTSLNKVNGPTAKDKDDVTFLLYTPWLMWTATVAMVGILLGIFGLAYGTTLFRGGSDTGSAYSLSLVQMAIWLILTTTGFVYIWIVTGQYLSVFTSGLFVLIGISGATAAVAQTLNRNDAPRSNGFMNDIVGKWVGGEVQLQRLQVIAWTLILALIFIWNVLGKLVLTPFDTNLLVLTGIANGIYVSLKPQEKKQ
jgi:hypothetical protein